MTTRQYAAPLPCVVCGKQVAVHNMPLYRFPDQRFPGGFHNIVVCARKVTGGHQFLHDRDEVEATMQAKEAQ